MDEKIFFQLKKIFDNKFPPEFSVDIKKIEKKKKFLVKITILKKLHFAPTNKNSTTTRHIFNIPMNKH